jgi:hypothetical protein
MVIGSTALFNLIIILIIWRAWLLTAMRAAGLASWLDHAQRCHRRTRRHCRIGFPSGHQHRPGQTSYPSSNRRHHSLFGSRQAAVWTFRARPRLVTGLLSLCVCA